ncbi:MAG: DNA mismatch repair protein MutS, partial [Tannerella sp.]|jgi:DNA mismatch repair ATPase MutS|nr:DNA mismatch repair protein MutS [Tannerella sp.]
MIWIVPAIWMLLVAGYLLNLMPLNALGIHLVVSFILANLPAKRIQKLYISANKMENILKTCSALMGQIEKEEFSSDILQAYKQKLSGEPTYKRRKLHDGDIPVKGKKRLPHKKTSASSAIKKLSRNIGALDQRFSTMGILLNLLYMRDTRQAIRLERWKREYSPKVKEWLDTLGIFDAFCSCGTFAFNHPDYIYPSITDTYCFMEGKGLGHPLLHRDKCVRNDVHIPNGKYFLIVTGANMAGKSTYLRTVGVNFALACTGMPVCAESLAVYPAHLVTSLRTADSLISNESYFFAELKRLKMMIDRLDAGEELFIILDEILKGTNSVDKQKGSIALVKQLIKKNACGIIATHDLLLGTLSDTFPGNVQNRRFEADIRNGELTFTYKIREGIAQNMNATFLMKKMGISGEDE